MELQMLNHGWGHRVGFNLFHVLNPSDDIDDIDLDCKNVTCTYLYVMIPPIWPEIPISFTNQYWLCVLRKNMITELN